MSLASPARPRVPATSAASRAALVAALNGAGLHATPYAPDNPTESAAWPQWAITNYNGHVCDPARHTYDVYAVLPGGEAETTVGAADTLSAAVAPALEAVGVVQSAEPVLITFADSTTMPGIRFRVVTRA